jgi:hypothetical protein
MDQTFMDLGNILVTHVSKQYDKIKHNKKRPIFLAQKMTT